jgi:CheY-like chemotaxis protein
MANDGMKSVLVVDDEPDMRFLLRLTLERSGFSVSEASTGEEALDMLERTPFDLLLLDLNLPGINGFSFLRSMKEIGRIDPPAVYMLTADADPELPDRALASGCAGFIAKGISSSEFVKILEETPAAGTG